MYNNNYKPELFTILIVDDVRLNRQLVESILTRYGYITKVADTGKNAIEIVKTSKIDLVILDLLMPEINGLEVCEIIKTKLKIADLPIIFLTASNEKEHLLQAFKLGAVDYIYKPFNALELLARVKNHLELKHTRDQLKQALIEIEKIAATDALTGVANRRQIISLAEREFTRVRRHQDDFSVFIMDIDHFKSINDTYGHDVGDIAIINVAKTTKNCVRNEDIFGRFGGEEFVAFLPSTNLEGALVLAERIRESISKDKLTIDGNNIIITVSIGVAIYRKTDANIDAMLKRADQALFKAKNLGRNRVVNSE